MSEQTDDLVAWLRKECLRAGRRFDATGDPTAAARAQAFREVLLRIGGAISLTSDSPVQPDRNPTRGRLAPPALTPDNEIHDARLVKLLDELTDTERLVIELTQGLRDGETWSQDSVAELLATTPEHVAEINTGALRKLGALGPLRPWNPKLGA